MKKILYISLLILICQEVLAQKKNFCANAAIDSIRLRQEPSTGIKKIRFEQALENLKLNSSTKSRLSVADDEIIRIPVVVHVIHNQQSGAIAGTNIPDEQIFSQVKVLNEDYRRKEGSMGFNNNPIGADTQIEFFLASKDPDGNPTTGITRHYNSTSSYSLINDNDRQKLSNIVYWDSNKYLNIWVTAYREPYIGYAEFPYAETVDGLEDEIPESMDGAFIDYRVFGKKTGTNTEGLYSFGRTATHEIGHWLGLIHTWGDEYCGTDYVQDTPPTSGSNSTAFCKDTYSSCNGTRTRNLIEDYMDYSPDSCMNIFTEGQKQRIRAVLELSQRRKRVVNYARFQLPPSNILDVALIPNPTTKDNVKVQVLLPDFQDFTISLTDIRGRKIYSETFSDYPSTIVTLKTYDLPAGIYIMNVVSKQERATKRLAVF
ncbi:M43 family zinc metalloprotease [Emticicia sp. BO119]|uniref:M43 family zinc metalloprotease n=1 Tax=Emticicia sp. BO119 TaxID=2757768 RepID=UPI0015EFE6AA|nr:M43 family zinc metalloprotease [Emticicia sp. BO119]MBA4853389.1 T9SS type A sorting domain-containing protein [Emticicia sp. BO119]